MDVEDDRETWGEVIVIVELIKEVLCDDGIAVVLDDPLWGGPKIKKVLFLASFMICVPVSSIWLLGQGDVSVHI